MLMLPLRGATRPLRQHSPGTGAAGVDGEFAQQFTDGGVDNAGEVRGQSRLVGGLSGCPERSMAAPSRKPSDCQEPVHS